MTTLAILGFLKPVLASVLSGVGAGFITSMKKRVKVDRPERLDVVKLGRTAVTAVIIGLIAAYNGVELTSANYDSYLAANAGLVMLAESLYVWLRRLVSNRLKALK